MILVGVALLVGAYRPRFARWWRVVIVAILVAIWPAYTAPPASVDDGVLIARWRTTGEPCAAWRARRARDGVPG